MLDVFLRRLSFRYAKSSFALENVTVTFPASTFTAIAGATGCGSSTLLKLIAGSLKPSAGEVVIGSRVVNDVAASRRPLLYATGDLDVPGRWSVRHALVNAVRNRSLDRTDRLHEISLALDKWRLGSLVERRVDTLSSGEAVRLHCARIELQKPAILVADRILERQPPAETRDIADDLYRTLRVLGTTVIGAPADHLELGYTDRIAVLDGGRLVQHAPAAKVFGAPASEAAARATGDVNVIPLTIRGRVVEAAIGSWEIDDPPFTGDGIALARPSDFHPAEAGEDSDFIFGVEEATFDGGRWIARGLLTGGSVVRVVLPAAMRVEKGRLIGMRFDPAALTLLPRPGASAPTRVPSGSIPKMSESR